MKMRRVVFWLHLGVGITVGLFVLVLSATGVLLTYERQIVAWAENSAVRASSGRVRLDPDALVARAVALGARSGHSLSVERDPAAAVRVLSGRRTQFLIDPFTGARLEGAGDSARDVFRFITTIHRWLAMSGERRSLGGALTGAANLGFLFLLVSGAWLWWPRLWRWPLLRHKLLLARDCPNSKARDYNWHQVFGAWAIVPLLAIVVSGVVISYRWAGDLVFRLYGETVSARAQGGEGGPGRSERPATAGGGRAGTNRRAGSVPAAPYAGVFAAAAAAVPDHRRLVLRLGPAGARTMQVVADAGNGVQFDKQTRLSIAAADGTILARETNPGRTPAARARGFLRFLHTGEVFGWIGQTVAGLVSLATLVLVYTGLALAWRRFFAPRRGSA
ncbi:MAG: PepSY domain-containing protein [Burkholderiaceae bacterium]|nr:PepSY domain-containing protein [Burkholderiaceae bacterium]